MILQSIAEKINLSGKFSGKLNVGIERSIDRDITGIK